MSIENRKATSEILESLRKTNLLEVDPYTQFDLPPDGINFMRKMMMERLLEDRETHAMPLKKHLPNH